MAYSIDTGHGTTNEYHNAFCDPCFAEKDLIIKIHGYCEDCSKFLCADCIFVHDTLKATRNHTVIKGDDMNRSKIRTRPQFRFCDNHQKQLKDKFCLAHKTLICSLCKVTTHKSCSVENAADTCKYIPTSEINTLYENVNCFQENLKSSLTSIKTKFKDIVEEKEAMLKEVQTIHDEMISKVNALFQDMKSELEAKFSSQLTLLSHHQKTINDVLALTERSLADVEKHKDKTIDIEVFLKMQDVVNDTNQCNKALKVLGKPSSFVSLSVVPSRTIQEFLASTFSFGSITECETAQDFNISIQDKDIRFPQPVSQPPTTDATVNGTGSGEHIKAPYTVLVTQQQCSRPNEASAKVAATRPQTKTTTEKPLPKSVKSSAVKVTTRGNYLYNVNLRDDKMNCSVTGLTITSDGRKLVVDASNRRVKLFTQEMKFLSSVSVPGNPWDVAVISSKVAVVSTRKETLVLLDVSGRRLGIKHTIDLSYSVYGVAKCRNKILVTSRTVPPSVKLIDVAGKVYWSTATDQQGQALFKYPEYVISHTGEKSSFIAVSDQGNDTLTYLNCDTGEVTSRCQFEKKGPYGLTTDSTGNLFVCYWRTGEVVVLSVDSSEERVLLSRRDGLHGKPQAIVYNEAAHQLILSYGDNNYVHRFQL